jgi:hypothetical protein
MIRISSARMMKVYGRSRASLTIHTVQSASPRPPPRNITEGTSLLIRFSKGR